MDDGMRIGVGNPLVLMLRGLLAGVLLWFVYGETGWATTLALSLIYVNTEATDFWVRMTKKNINMLVIRAIRRGGVA